MNNNPLPNQIFSAATCVSILLKLYSFIPQNHPIKRMKYYYHLHFTGEKDITEQLIFLPKITQLVSGLPETPDYVRFQSSLSLTITLGLQDIPVSLFSTQTASFH